MGPECEEAEELEDGSKVGKLLGTPLTSDGEEYVRQAYRNDPNSLVVKLWIERFDISTENEEE